MRWLIRLLLGRRRPTPEARAAREEATLSLVQAARDRDDAAARRIESDELAARLRLHNEANRYDDWLREVLSR